MGYSIFRTLYFLELVLISGVRTLSTYKYRRLEVVDDQSTRLDMTLMILAGLGMIVPLIYIFTPYLEFANYRLPDVFGWIGSILFVSASWVLWLAHLGLGSNWTPTLGFREEHKLVTTGIFKYIRHPMYAAHLLWAFAQPMMLHNWIAGFSLLVFVLPHYLLRVGPEEDMLVEKFGDSYREYMKTTGRIFPKLF